MERLSIFTQEGGENVSNLKAKEYKKILPLIEEFSGRDIAALVRLSKQRAVQRLENSYGSSTNYDKIAQISVSDIKEDIRLYMKPSLTQEKRMQFESNVDKFSS